MACHCRNGERERAMEGRSVEYERERIKEIYEQSHNLKEMESLELLNYILIINIVY